MNAPWRIDLLGGLRCRLGDQTITRFRSENIALLLAYLALYGNRRHSREELAGLLWPERNTDIGRTNLRVALASLRRQLEPPGVPAGAVLVADGRLYIGLNPDAVRVDVRAFDEALRQSHRAETLPEREAALLETAVGLYQGPLLPGFYQDWVLMERGRLDEAYREALRRLAAHRERAGNWDQALDCARRAVAADPLDEDAHADLIRLLIAAGQPQAALRQYETLERLLRDELGGESPSPELRALVAQIATFGTGAAQTDLPSPTLRLPVAPPPDAARLPLSFTRFFGREKEIETAAAWLASPSNRLVTITGPGGSGKTRLAVEVARRLVPAFANRVFFVPLADLGDASLIADALFDVLGIVQRPDTPLLEQAVEALAGAPPSLLVLDNFEHLAEAGTPLVVDLMSRVPSLACLVTSRERLLTGGEQELPIPPLPTPMPPDDVSPEQLLSFASVALFVDRAQAARPDFALSKRNARTVAELCARLEGLPLEIELAAAWAQTLTPAQMITRLDSAAGSDRRLDFLTSRRRDLPPRHRSLRAVLESSYRLLPPDERRLHARLSVFRGGWTVEAAECVCDEPDALVHLARLRERSLVLAEEAGDAMCFRMHETIRDYAAEQVSPEERAPLVSRHAAWFVALAEAAEPELRGAEQAAWLARLEREHDNLRAVLARCETDPEAALRLAGALGRFWLIRGHWSEGQTWLRKALAAGQAFPSARGKAVLAAATLAWALDAYGEATALCDEGLSLCRSNGDRWCAAYALALAGTVAVRQGDPARATALLEEALAQFRELDDRWGAAFALDNLGFAARDRGEHGRAVSLLEESLVLRRGLGDRQGIAVSLSNLGDAAQRSGDRDRAAGLHAESLHRFRALDDKAGVAYALSRLGTIALQRGDTPQAKERLQESLALFWELRDRRRIAECFEILAALRIAQGRHAAATRLLATAGGLREVIGAPPPLGARADFERLLDDARAVLGGGAFAHAWARGQAMSLDEAVTDALEAESETAYQETTL